MSFQILNKDGEPIPLNDLDREAAAFWGKEYDKKSYADPSPPRKEGENEIDYYRRSRGNWFDVIGFNIHSQYGWCSGWANIVANMLSAMHMSFIDTSEGYQNRPVKVAEFAPNPKYPGPALFLPEEVEVEIYCTLGFYKPYIELINHWQVKGYIPKQIKD